MSEAGGRLRVRNLRYHRNFMAKAKLNAELSTCLSRHVGAVATINRRALADGFNGNIPGAQHCDEGGCERCKNRAFAGEDLLRCVCVHAEANLVAWCARRGIALDGATVYCTTHPCIECLKLLLAAGVVEIIYDEPYPEVQKLLPNLGSIDVNIWRLTE